MNRQHGSIGTAITSDRVICVFVKNGRDIIQQHRAIGQFHECEELLLALSAEA